MNELLSTRLVALTLLFILTLSAGLGPVILFRLWSRRKQATILDVSGKGKNSSKITKSTASAVTLQIFMFFGGGVLLATCFVHLIPEVRENFDIYYHSQELSEDSSNSPRSSHSHHHGLHVHHFGGDHKHDHAHEAGLNHPHDHNHNHSHSHDDHPHDHSHGDHEAASSEVNGEAAKSNESAASSEKFGSSSHHHDDDDALESDESAPYTIGHTHKHKIPYVELAICGGFFLIYFLEEIIHLIIGHDHHDGEGDDDKDYPIAVSAGDYKSQRSQSCSIPNGKFDPSVEKSNSFRPAELVACNKTINTFGYDNHAVDLRGEVCLGKFTPQIDGLSNSSAISPTHSYDMLKMSYSVPTSVKFLRGLVTIIAFSAHSVFDGVAIGLQKTSSQLWTIFFAIFLHKVVVSFAIGLELYEQCESFALTTIHMILFSIMSPIGILLVIVTESEFSERDSPVMILLSAVATGTILYIVFFEVLQKDRASKLPGLIQFFFLVAGFACMSCLTLFVDH